ncbi:hypothetical protein [Marivita sp.]|uniref:hypothetical protein n=1 Tax=Marivita sp. TaxID=2003365 RepID=UPI003A8737D3
MPNITTETFHNGDLNKILETDERLLWSGAPGYGRRFLEVVGHERTILIAALFAIPVMWSSLVLISPDAQLSRKDATWVYGAVTLGLFANSLFLAGQRQYVLSTLAYFVTDKRALICRRGWNWRFGVRLYVVSCKHSATYPYSLIDTRPFPSLQIGTLLSVDQVQPFGWGLSHPGHSILRHRTTSNVTFDYIPDAQDVFELIQSMTGNQV